MTELTNNGFTVLRAEPPGDTATIIVVGVARSGTSMVAAALVKLGVFLGNRTNTSVYEDMDVAGTLERGDDEALDTLINARNAAHRTWGFKRPESFLLLPEKLARFRNPRVIVTFRDPVAIAQRNAISMHMDFLKGLDNATRKTGSLVDFVRACTVPTLMVSYEKAIAERGRFVEALIDFVGIEPDDLRIGAAIAAIDNGPSEYLDRSRIWFEGRFGGIVRDVAFGWLCKMPDKSACDIEIVSGGKVIGRGRSDRFREDLKERFGDRAFAIKLQEKPQQDVFARVFGTTYMLDKSPQFVMPQDGFADAAS